MPEIGRAGIVWANCGVSMYAFNQFDQNRIHLFDGETQLALKAA